MIRTSKLAVLRPEHEPRFASLREREQELMREIESLSLDQLRRFPLLSANAKTSVSLDFPIGHTCTPTALCASVCYASRPGTPARWDKSLVMRLRNLRYFKLAPTEDAVARLWKSFQSERQSYASRGVDLNFLRVNGTGDLFSEVVRALNLFARRHPEVMIWVVSRRPEYAGQLDRLPNVFLQLSVDSSTTPQAWQEISALVAENQRAYTSFLRTKIDDDTRGSAIVFNEKRTEGLPYDGIADCPVDAGRLELGNVRGKGGTACSLCRKCFSPKTLERQRKAAA